MSDIEVGDVVRVVDTGKQFSLYTEWASKHGLDHFSTKRDVEKGKEYSVVVIAPHSRYGVYGTLYGLRDETTGYEHIIGRGGIELVSKKFELQDDFDFTYADARYNFKKKSDGVYTCTKYGDDWQYDYVSGELSQAINLFENGVWKIVEKETELVEQQVANGVDANNKPLNFTIDDLQPFDRVITDSGTYIVVLDGDRCVLVGVGGWLDEDVFLYDTCHYFSPLEVYSKPTYYVDYFDYNLQGRLRWKRVDPEFVKRISYLEEKIKAVADELHTLQNEYYELKVA